VTPSPPRTSDPAQPRLRTQPAETITIRRRPTDPARPIDYLSLGASGGGATGEFGNRLDDAYRAGHDVGFAAGQAAARAEMEQRELDAKSRMEAALSSLSRSVDSARHSFDSRRTELEESIPQLVFDVLVALVGVESALSADPGRQAIARALALDTGSTHAVVRLHPDDVATLGELGELESGRTLTVVADPVVERGGALVDIGETTIDSQLSAALDRVRAVLEECGVGGVGGVGEGGDMDVDMDVR
jgi:flagellar assembly protein FliH